MGYSDFKLVSIIGCLSSHVFPVSCLIETRLDSAIYPFPNTPLDPWSLTNGPDGSKGVFLPLYQGLVQELACDMQLVNEI